MIEAKRYLRDEGRERPALEARQIFERSGREKWKLLRASSGTPMVSFP